MDMSSFVSSDPAVRRDGWSPERKLRFLDHLAARGNVRAACAAVGMTRETAYALRRRDALFARGWAAALLLAREASVELLADVATGGFEEEVWHRGELMGTKRRFDTRLFLAHLSRLDRMAEEADAATAEDAERFDELLACVAGVEIPEELCVDDEPLPLHRENALQMAAHLARDAVTEKWAERGQVSEDEDGVKIRELSDEDYAEYQEELVSSMAEARLEAETKRDAWFDAACRTVDALLGRAAAPDSSASTVSEVSGSGGAAVFDGPDGLRYARA